MNDHEHDDGYESSSPRGEYPDEHGPGFAGKSARMRWYRVLAVMLAFPGMLTYLVSDVETLSRLIG